MGIYFKGALISFCGQGKLELRLDKKSHHKKKNIS
jgi:hypothetical protein